MTTKERLHALVDELSEQEADAALRYIAARREDPVLALLDNAPEDDEPLTSEEEAALREADTNRAAGVRTTPLEEIKRKYGMK